MVQNAKYSICGGRWVNEWRIDQLEGLSALVWGLSTPSMALAIEATIGEPWLVVENVVFLWSQLAWCITHTPSTCLTVPSSVVSAYEQLQVWRWPWRQTPGLKIAWTFCLRLHQGTWVNLWMQVHMCALTTYLWQEDYGSCCLPSQL